MRLLLPLLALAGVVVEGRMMRKDELHAHQREAAKRFVRAPRATAASPGVKNITFSNPKASRE